MFPCNLKHRKKIPPAFLTRGDILVTTPPPIGPSITDSCNFKLPSHKMKFKKFQGVANKCRRNVICFHVVFFRSSFARLFSLISAENSLAIFRTSPSRWMSVIGGRFPYSPFVTIQLNSNSEAQVWHKPANNSSVRQLTDVPGNSD